MYHAASDFKEKLRKYVVRGERSLNRVFVVVILQGSWSECPQTAHRMNSCIHLPGQWGQSRVCWEILPSFSLQLPAAPLWLCCRAGGLGWCELDGPADARSFCPLISALRLSPFGLGAFAWLLYLSFSIYKMGIIVFTYLPHGYYGN